MGLRGGGGPPPAPFFPRRVVSSSAPAATPQLAPLRTLHSALRSLHPPHMFLLVYWSNSCCPYLICDLLHAVRCVSGTLCHANFLPCVFLETDLVKEVCEDVKRPISPLSFNGNLKWARKFINQFLNVF